MPNFLPTKFTYSTVSPGPKGDPGTQGPTGPVGPGGGTTTTALNYTQPAVDDGSGTVGTVAVTMNSVTGATIGQCCAVGGGGTYLVKTIVGLVVTLINQGGTGAASPTTVINAGAVVLFGGLSAPQKAIKLGGQSLIFINGQDVPVGNYELVNMRRFGYVGDNSHDDTAAVQAALNYMIANPQLGALFTPDGVGKITSTITMNVPAGQGFRWTGNNGCSFPSSCEFVWAGADFQPMFLMSGGSHMQIENMGFDHSSARGIAFQLVTAPITSGNDHIFQHCQFSGEHTSAYWQPNHVYHVNDIVVGPAGASITYSNASGLQSCNGHFYKCTAVTSDSKSQSPPVASFSVTAGAFVTDNHVTWQEVGVASAGFQIGDGYGVGSQMSECLWKYCKFQGISGWRQAANSNVKDFSFDHCLFYPCGRGLDVLGGSGSYGVNDCGFQSNSECDIYNGGGFMVVTSYDSESSTRLLVAQNQGASTALLNGYWAGIPANDVNGKAFAIVANSQIYLQGNNFVAGTGISNIPFQVAIASASDQAAIFACLTSVGNLFNYTTTLQVFDFSGNPYFGPDAIPQYTSHEVNISSTNDGGNSDGFTYVPFHDFSGRDVHNSRQQLSQRSAVGELPTLHVTPFGSRGHANPVMTLSVDHTLLTAGATSQTFTIACPFNKCKILDAYVDVTAGFTGLTTPTITVGKVIGATSLNVNGAPTGGVATPNAFITTGGSLSAATGATPIGSLTGNLAITWPGHMVWGANYANTLATQWAITITVSAANNVNLASAGSFDLYIEFVNYPGVH